MPQGYDDDFELVGKQRSGTQLLEELTTRDFPLHPDVKLFLASPEFQLLPSQLINTQVRLREEKTYLLSPKCIDTSCGAYEDELLQSIQERGFGLVHPAMVFEMILAYPAMDYRDPISVAMNPILFNGDEIMFVITPSDKPNGELEGIPMYYPIVLPDGRNRDRFSHGSFPWLFMLP